MAKKKANSKKKVSNVLRPERDDILEQVMALVDNHTPKEIAENTFIGASTIYNWRKGKTRYPSRLYVAELLRFAGYELRIVKEYQARKK